jgi:hypothetical protein
LFCSSRGLANDACSISEAETVYPLLGIIANIGLVLSGTWIKFVNASGAVFGIEPLQVGRLARSCVSHCSCLRSGLLDDFGNDAKLTFPPCAAKQSRAGCNAGQIAMSDRLRLFLQFSGTDSNDSWRVGHLDDHQAICVSAFRQVRLVWWSCVQCDQSQTATVTAILSY